MNLDDYIGSGAVECYVLGAARPAEKAGFRAMARKHPELHAETRACRDALEAFVLAFPLPPPPALRRRVLAKLPEK